MAKEKTNWMDRARAWIDKEEDKLDDDLFEKASDDAERKEAVEEKLNKLFYGDKEKVNQFSDLFVELSRHEGFEQVEELLFSAQDEIERVAKSQKVFEKESGADEKETVIERKDDSENDDAEHDYLNDIINQRYGA